MFLSSALPSMLFLPVFFFALQPINMNQCGLNIEEGEGENVSVCYKIWDWDCVDWRNLFHSDFNIVLPFFLIFVTSIVV